MNVANSYVMLTSATAPGVSQIVTGRVTVESVTIALKSNCVVGLMDATSGNQSGTVGFKINSASAPGIYPNVTFGNGLRLNLQGHAGHIIITYRQ